MSFWAIAQTQVMREHVAEYHLTSAGFETYLPRILLEHERLVPLFPSYIMVRIVEHWHVITGTIGVTRLLGHGDRPSQLADNIVSEIRNREIGGVVKLPKQRGLIRGQQVRIMRGPFLGHIGIFEGMDAHQRTRVLLEFLGRATPLDLPLRDLEPV